MSTSERESAPTHTGGDATRPPKQEQLPATEDIVEVAKGIRRLQLPIDLPGLGHVNTYALEDGDGFALVDPGLFGEASYTVLRQRLQAAEIPIARVHTVIVTHSHPDHFGAAGLLVEESGARLVAEEHFSTFFDLLDLDDRELELRDPDEPVDPDGPNPTPWGRPQPWGGVTEGPSIAQREGFEKMREMFRQWFRVPRPTHRLGDADRIQLAGREWVALFTPGHTDDHLCLFDPEEGVLLSGDHVLPTITPHISGMIEGDPLARFFGSLERVAQLEGVRTVLPAHGLPFGDLPGRVREIEEHHQDRLDRLVEIVDGTGWASVKDLSHELFAPKSWGSMAESETYAHLEHLRLLGRADRREEDGLLLYNV